MTIDDLVRRLDAMIDRGEDFHAILETAVQSLHETNPRFDWTGIYELFDDQTLRLGPFVGAPTDHVFSKATYLSDPDGIQLELTLETPERAGEITVGPASITIRDSEGRPRGMTEALDVREVLSHLTDGDLDRRLPIGTTVGHVHLHVADLEATRRFYTDTIGFEEHTFVPGIGFADLSAGGRFPHRVAFNVWQGKGAPPPPAGTAGMRFFELIVERGRLDAIRERLDSDGHPYELDGGTLITRDPSANELHLSER